MVTPRNTTPTDTALRDMALHEKLRHYREASALSQSQVAKALNINRTTYTKYETGKTGVSLKTLSKLAAIFNVTLLELLPPDEKSANLQPVKESRRADSPIFQLSKQERGLIASFRVLDKEDKAKALRMIGKMSKKAADKPSK